MLQCITDALQMNSGVFFSCRDLRAVLLYCPVDYLGVKARRLRTLSPCQLFALLSQTAMAGTKMDGTCHQLQTKGMQEVKEPFAQA